MKKRACFKPNTAYIQAKMSEHLAGRASRDVNYEIDPNHCLEQMNEHFVC